MKNIKGKSVNLNSTWSVITLGKNGLGVVTTRQNLLFWKETKQNESKSNQICFIVGKL
jgi:hypothetical protein